MKLFLSIIALQFFAPLLHAQWVVTNPISDALGEIQHFEDIAKAVEMINNQVEQINTLTQQLQQIQAYVKAFGDPEQLLNIVGADALIDSLNTSGVGQTLGELQSLASGVEALRDNANGLYQSVGETFTTPGGYELPRAEELYRKFAASQRATQNFESVYDDVSQRRGVLKARIADTTQQLQASTTDAETQKLAGVITGYNAELAAIDKEVDQALAQSLVLDIQNREDREKQEEARKEERIAEFSEAMRSYSQVFRIDDAPPSFPTR
ncbi:MAG TPA: hypothetical protein VIS71_07855 [Terrimicrobium sp.]